MIRVIALSIFLVACQTSGGTFCDLSKPIRLSDVAIDNLSDQEVVDILAHNEKGRKLCGWKR